MMPGISQAVTPALAILIVGRFGAEAPFAVSVVLAGAATAIVVVSLRKWFERPASPHLGGGLLERSALLPMVLEFTLTAVQTLFAIYPPLLAVQYGFPLEGLAAYYTLYGGALLASRITCGRILDRVGIPAAITSASMLAILSLVLAALATDLGTLTIAGVAFAASAGIKSPSNMSMAMANARPERLGSAMATYTLGYQLGIGVGAALWGVIAQLFAFPAPFLAALAVEFSVFGLLIRRRHGNY
jgi:predicted MFS family arabinose efflux permease